MLLAPKLFQLRLHVHSVRLWSLQLPRNEWRGLSLQQRWILVLQQNLDITIWVITISGGNNDLPSVPAIFCSGFTISPL
jgi:hypothetical protein